MDKITIDGKMYASIQDYAELKGVTRQTIYNWIKDGKINVKIILKRQFIEL